MRTRNISELFDNTRAAHFEAPAHGVVGTKMNAAVGQEKIDVMAEVVTELAVERKTMMSQMMGMQHECPMMKEMKEKEQ